MPIDARPDHVAVAVHEIDAAATRWEKELGGVWLAPRWSGAGFATRQLRYSNLAKLELLEPEGVAGFAAAFLDRFGPRIHHVTLKVPDLGAAIDSLAAAGYDAVDIDASRDAWHEAFLRPSQVGGIIVQIARSLHDDQGWADLAGTPLPQVDRDAPALLGPTLTHTDLDAARHLWSTLGARLTGDGEDAFEASWDDAPLTVRVERGETAGPWGLRFDPDPALPADDITGPGTLPS